MLKIYIFQELKLKKKLIKTLDLEVLRFRKIFNYDFQPKTNISNAFFKNKALLTII